jgi:signal transduction histidine kinase
MRRSTGFWFLVCLVAVLCLLGYLQYRWIDQLANAERERENEALQTAISKIAAAFDVEITRAMLAFSPGPPQFQEETFWQDRAQLWSEYAPHPRVLKDVYLTRGESIVRVTPSGLVPLQAVHTDGSDPIITAPLGPPEMALGTRTLVFDGDYIRHDLLPRIVSIHLNTERFGLRISSESGTVFASSDFRKQETTRLFSFRPECFGGGGRMMRRGGERRGGGPGGPGGPWRFNPATLISRTDVGCPEGRGPRGEGRWVLEAGLNTFATSGLHEFRTRTLLLGFGVLGVLAAGIAMLGLYAHRSQVLAQRQMEFAMAVSHELRTPLTVIRVAADSLAEGMVSDSKKYGDLIRRETVRLSGMVEQVLVFARAQRTDMAPQFGSVPVRDVVDRAVSAVEPSLASAGMKIECDLQSDLPLLRVDVNLLSAGLQNLLTNAAKYAASGGVVRVRAERSEPAHVRLVVEDEGPGVRPAELPRIFSAFYRAGDAANSRVPGLGLGLHLVKRIAEAHGGTVRAANRGARGFEVELRIPAIES